MLSQRRAKLIKLFRKLLKADSTQMRISRGLSNEELFERMEKVLTKKKIYLNKKMTVNDLAREAASNRTYVARALSSRGLNFKSYVNSFRIQYAIELMSKVENNTLRIVDIAERSGFSGERAMNSYLVKTIGVTAGVFRKRGFTRRE